MDFKTILVILLGVSVAAYFTPTPVDLQSKFKAGQDLYAGKFYDRAIEQYDQIIETDSRLLASDSVRVSLLNNELNVGVRTAAYYQKANALRNLGRKAESVEQYRVVERRPDSPKLSSLAQFQVYETYYGDKDYPHAIAEARVLIDRHPMDEKVPQAWYDIGWAFRELGQIDSSNAAFETLTRQYPENELDAKARYQIAQNLFDQQQWDRSIASFQAFFDKYRPERFAKAEWENVELKALRDRKLFEATTSRDVDAPTLELVAKAQVRVGDNYRKKGLYTQAMERYRSVIKTFSLMPTLVEATYIKMAEYTTEEKTLEEGLQVYRQAIDEHFNNKPLQAKLQYKIARTYQEQKQYAKASAEYLLFAKAYAKQGDEIRFTAEQAMFLAVSSAYNAKDYPATIANVDTTLVHYPATDYLTKLYLYRGLALSDLKRYDVSRTYLKLVAEKEPASNEAVIARTQFAKTLYEERKYPEAIAAFSSGLAGDRTKVDTSEIHYYLGLSYYGIPDYDHAINELSLVAPSSSYYPFTFARVVRAYSAAQQYDRALRYLDQTYSAAALDTTGIRPFIRLARAELYSAQQMFPEAVAQFDSIAVDSTLTQNTRLQAIYGRGLVRFEMASYDGVARDLRTCLNSGVFQQVYATLVPQAKEKLAFALVYLNKANEGEGILAAMVKSAPSEIDRCRYMAILCEFYFRAAQHPRAIETGKQVVAMTTKDDNAVIRSYITISNAYGALQQPGNAIATVKQASEAYPANSMVEDTFYRLAMVYYTGADYANAGEAFRLFMERYPSSKSYEDAFNGYAYCLYQTGRADESIKTYREFLRKYPRSAHAADAQLQIGEAYFNTGRFTDAAREYQALYTEYPKNENAAIAMYNEGWSYYQTQLPEKMLDRFRALITGYPESRQAADAQFTIGDYYYNAKEYPEALGAYEEFLRLFPTDARIAEANTLLKDLRQVEAYKAYEKAMEYFDSKNWKQAIVELDSVMARFPGTEVAYGCKANIASCYEQLGETPRALATFEEILRDWKEIEGARSAVFFAELHKRWIEAGKH